jgi:hypothetical protein
VAYRVVWHAGGTPEPGRLLIGPDSLRLIDYDEAGKVVAELAFDDLEAIRLPRATKGRRPIVLKSRHEEWIEVEGAVDQSILPHVLEQAISHLLATPFHRRGLLVSVRLRPGGLQRALALLQDNAPVVAAPSSVRDVFVLGDEVLLLFARGNREDSARETKLWDAIAGWDEFILEIGIAEHAYARIEAHADRSGGE